MLRKRLRDETGTLMVEGTIGVVMLLLAALAAVQILLFVHAALAAKSAAVQAARSYAVTGQVSAAERIYEAQQSASLGAIGWQPLELQRSGGRARATVGVSIPPVFPGAGVLGGGGLTGRLHLQEYGEYPIGDGG